MTEVAGFGQNQQQTRTRRKTPCVRNISGRSPFGFPPDRLVNADREPQNWLMNHRTYDGQRFSPLARINRDNVRNLKLAYAVALGGSTGDEWTEATPLVEDGFIYIVDGWGVLYKIDG